MADLKGMMLVPTTQNPNGGLWFIFHHEEEGVLAFDLTTRHPDIPYRHFKPLTGNIDGEVLHGGPMQSDSGLLILHQRPDAGPDAHIVSRDLCFHSFRFTLLPGNAPTLTRADDSAAALDLGAYDQSLVVLGFRLWDMDALETELRDWRWMLLPATPEIVFHTPAAQRLEKARRAIN